MQEVSRVPWSSRVQAGDKTCGSEREGLLYPYRANTLYMCSVEEKTLSFLIIFGREKTVGRRRPRRPSPLPASPAEQYDTADVILTAPCSTFSLSAKTTKLLPDLGPRWQFSYPARSPAAAGTGPCCSWHGSSDARRS